MKLQVWNSEHLSFFGVLSIFFKYFPGVVLTAATKGSRGCVTHFHVVSQCPNVQFAKTE